MSGTASITGTIDWGAGALGVILADARSSRAQLDTLTEQAGSGRVADTYGGLSPQAAAVSLSLQPTLSQAQTLGRGIDAVQGRLDVAQSALSHISKIASDFYAKTDTLNGLTPSEVDSVAASARDALSQVAGLLDSKDGDIYVFAGTDTANPPVPDPDHLATSAFANAISAAVANLAGNGAAATAASTLAVASPGGTSPFSAALTAGGVARPSVPTGDGNSVPIGIVAGSNGDITSGDSSTTGSYIRDILRGLATLGALSSSQTSAAGFAGLVADTRNSLGGAITALNQDAGVLGDRQSALKQTSAVLSNQVDAFTKQISGVEDVDMASTLTALSAAQTKLQSSYQLIASLQSLSLTKYLTPA